MKELCHCTNKKKVSSMVNLQYFILNIFAVQIFSDFNNLLKVSIFHENETLDLQLFRDSSLFGSFPGTQKTFNNICNARR